MVGRSHELTRVSQGGAVGVVLMEEASNAVGEGQEGWMGESQGNASQGVLLLILEITGCSQGLPARWP